MLSATSAGLIRENLKGDLIQIGIQIEFWKHDKLAWSRMDKIRAGERHRYLLADHMIRKLKKERKKVEAAIKEVKANLWNGSVKSFSVSSFVLSPVPPKQA